jgi:hypothetical protein
MNKFTLALALGAGLVLSLAGPSVHADPIQQLPTPTMSAADFNSLFQPIPGADPIVAPYQFLNTPNPGVVESQVFQGTDKATGLYAYAYQIAVNKDAMDTTTGQPTSVNSATLTFNATPTPASFTSGATPSSVYVVPDGKVGSIDLPQAAPGSLIQTPTSVAWMPGSKTGALTFQYLDATQNTGPLQAGANSATIVVLTNQPYTTQPVSLQNADPQTGYPQAYSAQGGTIQQVPVPEPATALAWAGMIGAVALVRRVRRNRQAA